MVDKQTPTIRGQSFEGLKQTKDHGAEYWSARDLQSLLGYGQWRRFEGAITRTITSGEQSGSKPDYHFASAGKMIELGKGGVREVEDYQLSRFACYLIAQNGDPRKPEIAQAQKYFAIQARRQELTDQLAADVGRLELRKQTLTEFKAFSGAAQRWRGTTENPLPRRRLPRQRPAQDQRRAGSQIARNYFQDCVGGNDAERRSFAIF